MDDRESSRQPWLTNERAVLLIIVMIAVLGFGYLGWPTARIVQYRRAMRAQIEADGGLFNGAIYNSINNRDRKLLRPADHHSTATRIRRLLGDKDVGTIWLMRRLTAEDQKAIGAFPEADVVGFPALPSSAPEIP